VKPSGLKLMRRMGSLAGLGKGDRVRRGSSSADQAVEKSRLVPPCGAAFLFETPCDSHDQARAPRMQSQDREEADSGNRRVQLDPQAM
jgi:hypothetical protein